MLIPKDARAIVTGAGSGCGRALSFELAKRGARVLVSDVDLNSAERTAREIGGAARAMRADVCNPKDVEALVGEWGVDVMVNNAGVAVVGRVGEIPLEDWRLEIEVNLMGVIYGCHYAAPEMRKQKRGFILNVASHEEVDPALKGELVLVDSENNVSREVTVTPSLLASYKAEYQRFCTDIESYCSKYQLGYVRTVTDFPFEELVLKVFRQGRFLK